MCFQGTIELAVRGFGQLGRMLLTLVRPFVATSGEVERGEDARIVGSQHAANVCGRGTLPDEKICGDHDVCRGASGVMDGVEPAHISEQKI